MTAPTSGDPPAADDARALDELFSVTYEELRRLASAVRRGDPSATLSPTALVNEAWLKLRESPHVARTSPAHFRRIAARAMRQVLVEAARRRQADKRGGGALLVTFDESLHDAGTGADDLLALDHALERSRSHRAAPGDASSNVAFSAGSRSPKRRPCSTSRSRRRCAIGARHAPGSPPSYGAPDSDHVRMLTPMEA